MNRRNFGGLFCELLIEAIVGILIALGKLTIDSLQAPLFNAATMLVRGEGIRG